MFLIIFLSKILIKLDRIDEYVVSVSGLLKIHSLYRKHPFPIDGVEKKFQHFLVYKRKRRLL